MLLSNNSLRISNIFFRYYILNLKKFKINLRNIDEKHLIYAKAEASNSQMTKQIMKKETLRFKSTLVRAKLVRYEVRNSKILIRFVFNSKKYFLT